MSDDTEIQPGAWSIKTRPDMEPWTRPDWQLYLAPPESDRDLREYGIESMLRLGSDEFDQAEWAFTQLRLARPDLTVVQLRDEIDHLILLANEVAEQDRRMGSAPFIAALDEYRDALHIFARGPARPDDTFDVALAVQEPVASAPLTLVRR